MHETCQGNKKTKSSDFSNFMENKLIRVNV